MRIVKWLFGIVLVAAALVWVGGLLLSPKVIVARSIVIAAPPDKVYALLVDPRQWKRWTAWNRRDPQMQMTFSGAASGAGAAWAWKSKGEGDGRMLFTAAEPGRRLAYELYFPEFDNTSGGDLSLAAEGAGTRVTWTMNGDFGSNPLWRWMALFADRMIGPDFEAGLANLKAEAEKP